MKRVRLIISGNVQGVGFRAWIQEESRNLGLTGWVKNREDGTVEVVAEGEKSKLEGLVVLCRRGPEVAWVEKIEAVREKASGEFVNFEVRF